MQSYFLHFKNGAFTNPEIQELLINVREKPTKEAVIFAYELGLSRLAREVGLLTGPIYPWNSIRNFSGNPSVESWKELISMGSPMVKREVVRSISPADFNDLLNIAESSREFGPELRSDLLKDRTSTF